MEYPNFEVLVRCFTFNQESYIRQTLDSFSNQKTEFPFICCVVDDASPDKEQEVINKYIISHVEVIKSNDITLETENNTAKVIYGRHILNRNCYFVFYLLSRNIRFEPPKYKLLKEWYEKAKYEAICEGDDYWIDQNKLQKQVDYMNSHPKCSLIHTGFKYFYEGENKYLDSIPPKQKAERISLDQKVLGYYIQTCTVMYRISDNLEIRRNNEFLFGGYFLMGDFQTWYELLKKGYFYYLPDITSVYRKNDGSATRARSVTSYYRFELSSAEIRYYVSTRDGLNTQTIRICEKRLHRSLLHYKSFDRNFTSKVDYSLKLNWYENILVNSGLLSWYLKNRLYIQHQLGSLLRKLITKY